jgi:hypothetical protein
LHGASGIAQDSAFITEIRPRLIVFARGFSVDSRQLIRRARGLE